MPEDIAPEENHILLPTEINDSLDPEDQVIRETAREVNRLSDILNNRNMQTHIRSQTVSRKFQGLKILGDQLASRRVRTSTSTLYIMAKMLQCVQQAMENADLRKDHQHVVINNLALLLEDVQKQDPALKSGI